MDAGIQSALLLASILLVGTPSIIEARTVIPTHRGGSSSMALDEIVERIKRSTDRVLEEKLQQARVIYRLDETPTPHRARRAIPDQLTKAYEVFHELISVQNLTDVVFPNCIDVESFSVDGRHLIVTIEDSLPEERTVLYQFNTHSSNQNVTELQSWNTADAKDLAVFQANGKTILIVMESNSDTTSLPTGTVIYELDTATMTFQYIQRVYTDNPTNVEVFQANGQTYAIFVGAFVETFSGGVQRRVSALYRWQGGHLDKISTFVTGSALDVHPFQVHSQTFLALANHTDSHILHFNPHQEAFVRYQDIAIIDAVDWEYFYLGDEIGKEDQFLVAATAQGQSIIYKLYRDEFVPFQSFPTPGARQWHAIQNTDGTMRVLALASDDGIGFFEYNGWRFERSSFEVPLLPSATNDFGSMSSFDVNDDLYLVVANNSTLEGNAFMLGFSPNAAVQQLHRDAAASCMQLRKEIVSLQSRLESLETASENLVYVNSPDVQVVMGNKTFQQNVTMETVVVKKIDADNGMIFDAGEKIEFRDVKSNQTSSFAKLSTIKEDLDRAVRKTGPRQIITGQKTFASLTVTDLQTNTVNVDGDVINRNVNLTELVTNTWRKDKDESLDVPFSIAGNVNVLGNLTISGTLDGVDLTEVVTLSNNHTIEGSKQFHRPIHFKGNLDVLQFINGVEVSDTNLLLTHGDQTIQSNLTVTGIVEFSDDVSVDGLVDGCSIYSLGMDAVLTEGDFFITGDKIFSGDITAPLGITLNSDTQHTFDGVNVLELNRTIMRTTGDQTLTGNYVFNGVVVGNLSVSGRVNELLIPADILLSDSTTEAILAGNWTFADHVTMSVLTAETSIDGILATGSTGTGLEVLQKDAEGQTVEGAITFAGGISLAASSQVTSGIVDGVHIESVLADAVLKSGDQQITGEKTFASSVDFGENLQAHGFVNGINITAYDARAVKLFGDDSELVFNGDVKITASETKMAGPLLTNRNHSFPLGGSIHDLVIQGEQDVIHGSKSFPGVTSDDDVATTTVNGLNVSRYFEDSVRVVLGEVLVIDGNVTFWDDVKMEKNLNIQSGFIDGIYIPDIVTLTNDSSVELETIFTGRLTAQDLYVHTLAAGQLNGHNVVAVDGDTLKMKSDGMQQVTGNKTFLNGLTIIGNLVVNGNTNGVDLSAVEEDAVYTNRAHTNITAGKIFECILDIKHLNALDHVDDVHIPSFSERVLRQEIPQTIEGALRFSQDLHFDDNVTVAKTINSHSVTTDLLRVLSVEDSSYDGELEFSDVVSESDSDVLGTLDGHLTEDLVLKQADFQTISGEKVFLGNLTSQSSMVALLINSISIDNLNAIAARYNQAENIYGNKTFAGGISLKQNLTVTTLVDKVNVRELEGDSLMINYEGLLKQIYTGNGTLGDIIVHGNLTYNGTIDGVDLEELAMTYMSRSLPQTVTGNKTFLDTVTVASPGYLDARSIHLEGLLNGVDLEEFASYVWIDGNGDEVSGIKTFTGSCTLASLNIGGTINGMNLTAEAMITNRNNTVTGYKTFTGSSLTADDSIIMEDLKEVDGVDLSEYKRTAVTLLDDYNMTHPTTFAGISLQNNLEVHGKIDNVTLSANNLLLNSGTQEITGTKTFSQDVTVSPNIVINGLLNGVDLVDLFENTLLISPNQTIIGNYTFLTELILSNATTHANVDGLRIPELYRHVYTYPSFKEFNRSLQLRCDMLNRMHAAQEDAAILLAHLVIGQVIDTIGYLSWHAFYYDNVQWLVAAQRTTYPPTSCVPSSIYQYNATTGDYEYFQSLHPKSTVDVDSFVVNGRLFLALAGKYNDTGQCDNFPRLTDGYDVDSIVTHNRTVIPSSLYGYSTTNILVWLPDEETFYLYQALPCASPSDIEVFLDPLSNQTCLVVANEVYISSDLEFQSVLPSYVYCLKNLQEGFYLKDTFITAGVSKIRHFFRDGVLHLAVANRLSDIEGTFSANSAVLQQVSNGSFVSLDTVEGSAADDILAVTIEDNWYIVLGNEFSGSLNDPDYDIPVEIYRFSDSDTLVLEQEIDVFGARSLGSFTTDDQFFLIIMDQVATTLYMFKGIELFVKIHTLTTDGATSLHVFPRGDSETTQIAVAAYQEQDLFFEGQTIHALDAPSLILDIVLKGERLASIGCSDSVLPTGRRPGGGGDP